MSVLDYLRRLWLPKSRELPKSRWVPSDLALFEKEAHDFALKLWAGPHPKSLEVDTPDGPFTFRPRFASGTWDGSKFTQPPIGGGLHRRTGPGPYDRLFLSYPEFRTRYPEVDALEILRARLHFETEVSAWRQALDEVSP